MPETMTNQLNCRAQARPLSVPDQLCPTLTFYVRTITTVMQAAWTARQGYSLAKWARDSQRFCQRSEASGLRYDVENLDAFVHLSTPCVIVGNHMSTLETFALPGLLAPIRPVTFVIKRGLTVYPVFRHVINATQPIVVDRINPRDDYKAVMDEGLERLGRGLSIILFPQTTRTSTFSRAAFNSIGVKLARKAGVPVLPLALKTDAWGTGTVLKDFGRIRPERRVRFAFGEPVFISGPGKNEHEEIIEFIYWKQKAWQRLECDARTAVRDLQPEASDMRIALEKPS